MSITNFSQARKILEGYVPPARKFREAYTLDTMHALMGALGNPQEAYRVVHVAGTSGKTSTAYYVASLLGQSGKKVGLTVSPHITEINERVQINGRPLDEKAFCSQLEQFLNLINKLSIKPTYFEVLVAFAYWQFAQQKVDYAVVEVGLGGLLDGTNVISNPAKVCVITDIGLDHTNVLGTDLLGIAAQKAGIIHHGNAVFAYHQPEGVADVIRQKTVQAGARLHEVEEINETSILPKFQQRNFTLALQTAQYVLQSDAVTALTDEQIMRAMRTLVPGRMETFHYGSKSIILDGAHNPQKMRAFTESFAELYEGQKAAILVALVAGKDMKLDGVLSYLLPHASHLIITDFQTQQDLRKVAIDPVRVAKAAQEKFGFTDYEIVAGPDRALETLLNRQEDMLVITGSFYLLNHVRPLLLDKHD